MKRVALVGAMVVVAGCGDDAPASPSSTASSSSSSSSGSGGSGGNGGGGGAGGATLQVVVTMRDAQLSPPEPAVGAAVAVDAAGSRIEQVVDADGRATFEGVDFSADDVLVVAALAGHGFAAVGRVQADAGEIALGLTAHVLPTIQVSGDAAGMVDPVHFMAVTPSLAGATVSQMQGASYSLMVPAETPFGLVATEFEPDVEPVSARGISQVFYGWTSASSPGLTADAVIPFDFANGLTPKPFSGSFPNAVPADSALGTSGRAYVTVNMLPGNQHVGAATLIDTVDGETFEYSGEYVETEGVALTRYFLFNDFEQAGAQVEGFPIDGPHADLVLPAPPLKTPPGFQSIDEPIVWEPTFQDETTPYIIRIFGDNGSFSFVAYPPGTTQGVIPKLPSAVDPSTVLGDGDLTASIGMCSPPYIQGAFCSTYASGRGFGLQR